MICTEVEEEFSKSVFRKLEKLYTKSNKAELDIKFLKNCQSFNVFPKFVCFNIPTINHHDSIFIKKKLLKSALGNVEKNIVSLIYNYTS